ncbi:MAG: hypothetical protein WBG71_08070 [Leeuwenhoekiella sp.]
MIYLFFVINMHLQNPSALIGENINVLSHFEEVDFSKEDKNAEIRVYRSNDHLNFLGENIEGFFVSIDKDETIISVRFAIRKIIYHQDYKDNLVEVYGPPKSSFCMGEIIETSKTILPGGGAVGSTTASTKKCDFDDPSVIFTVWKLKENLFLELTHPQMQATFPRAYVCFTKSSKLMDIE